MRPWFGASAEWPTREAPGATPSPGAGTGGGRPPVPPPSPGETTRVEDENGGTTMSVVNCATCGVGINLADDVEASLRRSGSTFYCHAGHSQSFRVGPTKAEREVKRLEDLLGSWIAYHDERIRERDVARRRARTCPLCDEVLRARGRLGWHLEQVHGARSAEAVARDLEDLRALEGEA